MREIAKHCVALRDPKGRRLQVMPGQALPDWVSEETRGQLRTMGALEPYLVADPVEKVGAFMDAEGEAESLRAAAESVVEPGGNVGEILGAEAQRPGGTPIEPDPAGGATSAGTAEIRASEASASAGEPKAPADGEEAPAARKAKPKAKA